MSVRVLEREDLCFFCTCVCVLHPGPKRGVERKRECWREKESESVWGRGGREVDRPAENK